MRSIAMELEARELGRYSCGVAGPTLIVTGGLHGNESSGVTAIARVLEYLHRERPPLRGEIVGLRGNRRALAAGQRYVDRDLNRAWTAERLAGVVAGRTTVAEDEEQRELLEAFDPYLHRATRPVMFLDLHSTSGKSVPFVCGADVLRNRRAMFGLGIPVVLGLEEVIEGSMLGYLCDLGHAGIAVEGGSHFEPDTVDNHVSAVWLVMLHQGLVEAEHVPGLDGQRERLRSAGEKQPAVVEIVHREVVGAGDLFEMNAGWTSFQPVERGAVVATGSGGPIPSPASGLMLLPRYQGLGEDGFFVARPVQRAWLRLSAVVRRLRLDRALAWLPGVARDPDAPDTLVARGSIARTLAPDLFHLFGYRRSRPTENGRVFMRRQPDDVGVRPLVPRLSLAPKGGDSSVS